MFKNQQCRWSWFWSAELFINGHSNAGSYLPGKCKKIKVNKNIYKGTHVPST